MELIIPVYSEDSAEVDAEVAECTDKSKIKSCFYCGKPFVAKTKRYSRCTRHHYSYCSICGKIFSQDRAIYIGNKLTEVCDNKVCRNTLSGRKAKEALQRKYGWIILVNFRILQRSFIKQVK